MSMKKWTIKRECGDDVTNISREDIKDIFYRFFLTDRFKTGDAFEITTPEGTHIEFPEIVFPWGFWKKETKNRDFIANKNNLLKLTNLKDTEKRNEELVKYWDTWFYCFGHPLIYLQYERLILNTEEKHKHSEKKYRETTGEEEVSKDSAKKDKTLELIYKTNYALFCKTRTRFIKCYGETIKPAHFCSGTFSKIPGNKITKKHIIDTVEKLGYPTIREDLENFAGNEGIHHSMYLTKRRRKEKEIEASELSREDKIKKVKRELEKLLDEEKTELELEAKLDEEENMDEMLTNLEEEDASVREEESNTKKTSRKSKQSFGKINNSRIIDATARVLTKWKSGNKKEAITLFKMYESVLFKNPRTRTTLHKVMWKARPLF